MTSIRIPAHAAAQRLLTSLLASILVLIPAIVPADWDTPFGDAGRSFSDSTAGVTPPISVRGAYHIEENLLADVPPAIVTSNRVILLSPTKILAFTRVEESAGDEPFSVTEPRWRYEVEGANEDDIFLGRALYPGEAVSNPTRRLLVFIEEAGDLFGVASTELVALHMDSGEEVWRYELGGMQRPAMTRAGNSVLVRWVDPEVITGPFWDDLPGRLMRIVPGADEPQALVEIEEPLFSSSYRSIVTSDGVAFLPGESGIAAYDTTSLAHRWTWPPDGSRQNSGAYEGITSMVSGAGNVYFIQRDQYRVTSLDRDGNVRWIRELMPEGESCTENAWLSLHPDMLVVTGVCNTLRAENGSMSSAGRFYGLNPDTGEIAWNIPAPWFQGPMPAVISGNHFFRDHIFLGDAQGLQTRVYNVHTGAVVQSLISPEIGMMVGPVAARDGHLFAHSLGLFGAGMGRVFVFETEPADMGVEFAQPERVPCGTPVGRPITVPVSYSNLGPGLAPDATIELRQSFGSEHVEWLPPDGYESTIVDGGRIMRISLGDLEAGASGQIPVQVVPLRTGNPLLRVSVESGVRHTNSNRTSDGLILPVIDEPPANLDLSIAWVEVTQGLQDRDNSIGLIAGRPTLIRVYAESNVPIDNVQAVMRLTDDTNPDFSQRFFNRPVDPFRNCVTLGPGSWNRDDYDTSINFLLPPELLDPRNQRPLKMEILLDPDNLLGEANRENSVYTRELQFDAMAPICLVTHSVRSLRMGGGDTFGPHLIPQDHLDRATAMLPTPEVVQVSSGNTLEKVVLTGGLIPPTEWGPYELDPGGSINKGRLLATLLAHSITTSRPAACGPGASVHHTGVVAEDNLSTLANANFNGYAWMVDGVFTFRVRQGAGSDFNLPRGGRTLAHELGHTFNRFHVDCGDPAFAQSNIPYPGCQLGPLGPNGFFGVDLVDPMNPFVIPPRAPDASRTLGDLMSYADDVWTSDYTWNAVREKLALNLKHSHSHGEHDAARQWLTANKGTDGKLLLVSATIEGQDEFILEDVLQLSSGAVPEENMLQMAAEKLHAAEHGTPYSIELRNGSGATILDVPVNAELVHDSEPPYVWIIGALIPMPDGVEELRVLHEDEGVLATVERSPSAPEVELLLPASGDVVDDILVVDWEASDPDGGILSTMIQYSTDDGENWTTLAVNAPDEPFVFEADLLPGTLGEGRIRVIVSDGFNATEAVSDPFTVTPREPLATIHSPENNQAFAPGEPIFIRGTAYDPEDGPLRGESLAWEIPGTGSVGTGESLILTDLDVGTHQLVLTATDSDGQSTTAEVSLIVAPRQATQTEIAGVLLGVLEKVEGVIYDITGDHTVDSADVQEAAP